MSENAATIGDSNKSTKTIGDTQGRIEIGGGTRPKEGYFNLDQLDIPAVDYVIDFEKIGHNGPNLPFADDSVSEVYSSHCLEHIRNIPFLLHDICRVCRVDATVTIKVPWWNHEMAMCGGHVCTISPKQVDHWCLEFVRDWWPKPKCKKRLQLQSTTIIPTSHFQEIRQAFQQLSDITIYNCFSNTASEVSYGFMVIPNE